METPSPDNQEEIKQTLLEGLQADTPEYELVAWLNQSLGTPAAMVERHAHYRALGRRANLALQASHHDRENGWLTASYLIPVGVFYWGMDQYCCSDADRALETEQLRAGAGQPGARTAFKDLLKQATHKLSTEPLPPEFSLDIETVRPALFADAATRQAAMAAHREHADRIDNLCKEGLPETLEKEYKPPLVLLLMTHKHIARGVESAARLLD